MDLVYLIVCFFDVVLFGAEDTIEPRSPSCIDFFPTYLAILLVTFLGW